MDKYPKLFIKFSIIYLLFGLIFGLVLVFDLSVDVNPIFIHVHLNLLGFMAMMVFGVAYHILPRFNGKPVKYPSLISAHFYIANVGLIGLILSYFMGGYLYEYFWTPVFQASSIMTVASVFLFAFNMFPVLTDKKETIPKPAQTPPASKPVQKRPQGETGSIPRSIPPSSDPPSALSPETLPIASDTTINKGDKCSKDVLIGDLITVYPTTKSVFEKHYGSGCFSCPGQATETIEQTARIHGIDVDMVVAEINEIIEKG